MSNGGMIQVFKDGEWVDRFPVSDKTYNATDNVSRRWQAPARLVDRNGRVLYVTEVVPRRTRGYTPGG